MNNVRPPAFLSHHWNRVCNIACIEMMHCSSPQALRLGSMVRFGSDIQVRRAEGNWILLGFENKMLFVNFTGRLLGFLEEQVNTLCVTCSMQALKKRNGWFIPGVLGSVELSSVPFWWETTSKHLLVPVQSNAAKSCVLGHFIYFNKINK